MFSLIPTMQSIHYVCNCYIDNIQQTKKMSQETQETMTRISREAKDILRAHAFSKRVSQFELLNTIVEDWDERQRERNKKVICKCSGK